MIIHDHDTMNQSFLNVHKDLVFKGVINNDFMLELHNPRLKGVNPFDKELPPEMKRAIVVESIKNFWYFAREVVRWPIDIDGTISMTKLDKGNAVMYWCSLNGITTWRTNIRQTCSDLSVETLMLWMLLTYANHRIDVISGSNDPTGYQMLKVRNLYKMLPEYFHFIIDRLSSDKKSVDAIVKISLSKISNPNIGSEIRGIPKPTSVESAYNALRGNRSDVMFFHMAEYIPELKELITNRAPVICPNNDYRKRINIFNSAYGRPEDDTTIFSQNYIESMIKWKDTFYDLVPDELICSSREYGNGVIYIKHSYSDLGYTREWAEDMKKAMDKRNFMKEILLIRSAVGISEPEKRRPAFNAKYNMDAISGTLFPSNKQ